MTDKRALNHEALWSPVASGCFLILDESWCHAYFIKRTGWEKNKYGQRWGGIRRRCRRMMWRRKQEKKVTELKKGDCNKIKKKDQVKRFKNKWCISPEKLKRRVTETWFYSPPNKYAGPNKKFFTLHQHKRRKRERKTFCVIERLRRRGEKDKLDEMHKLERKFVI